MTEAEIIEILKRTYLALAEVFDLPTTFCDGLYAEDWLPFLETLDDRSWIEQVMIASIQKARPGTEIDLPEFGPYPPTELIHRIETLQNIGLRVGLGDSKRRGQLLCDDLGL